MKRAGRDIINCILVVLFCAGISFFSQAAVISEAASLPSFDVNRIRVPDSTSVLVVVEANGEETNTTGRLYAYTRQVGPGGAGSWKRILNGVEALLGKGGMGKTKEGDKKSPVGMFTMNTPFGIAEKKTGFPDNYLQVNDHHYWVGDCASSFYNRLVDITQVPSFSTSDSEHLIEVSPAYNYAIDTGYNSECKSGAGSALFLHCFKADHSNSSGCIAISEENMITVMKAYQEKQTVILIDTKGCFEKYY